MLKNKVVWSTRSNFRLLSINHSRKERFNMLNNAPTKNPSVLAWLEDKLNLVNPDKVVWIDGSEEQIEALRAEACATGEMIKLNPLKMTLIVRLKLCDIMRPTSSRSEKLLKGRRWTRPYAFRSG